MSSRRDAVFQVDLAGPLKCLLPTEPPSSVYDLGRFLLDKWTISCPSLPPPLRCWSRCSNYFCYVSCWTPFPCHLPSLPFLLIPVAKEASSRPKASQPD